MQKIFNYSFRVLLAGIALLLITPVASANNSVVLLVEQPIVENLPITIATSQSALQNFIKKNGSNAEIAVISYSTTADVIAVFTPLTTDTSIEITSDLKKAGARGGSDINTASGMERAIALLNEDANPDNSKILLVVSDANIATGNKDLDMQFTEWLTEIISEDAVKSGIEVSWHPITQNANHSNIDAFLERLNGQRVVLSPDAELIDEAARPQPPSKAEQQLALITSQLESEPASEVAIAKPPAIVEEVTIAEPPTIVEDIPLPVPAETKDPVVVIEEVPTITESLTVADNKPSVEEKEAPLVLEQLPELATADSDFSAPEPIPEEQQPEAQAAELLSPSNIKIAVLVVIAFAATFLLKTLLSKRRDSVVSGTGLADKEYRDSSEVAISASSMAAVTTRANAPIIPARTPPPEPAPIPTPNPAPIKVDDPEPVPKPLAVNDTLESTADEDPLDGTQEVFPEFSSSASLNVAPLASQEEAKADIKESVTPEPEKNATKEPNDTLKQVDPYATVIAEAPDFSALAGTETLLAEETEVPVQGSEALESTESQSNDDAPAIDPYATVIADASQIQAYAKQFTDSNVTNDEKTASDEKTEDDDPDKTVLYRPDKDM